MQPCVFVGLRTLNYVRSDTLCDNLASSSRATRVYNFRFSLSQRDMIGVRNFSLLAPKLRTWVRFPLASSNNLEMDAGRFNRTPL